MITVHIVCYRVDHTYRETWLLIQRTWGRMKGWQRDFKQLIETLPRQNMLFPHIILC